MAESITIEAVEAPNGIAHVRSLFIEYCEWLAEDLCFQDFDREIAGLPGLYAAPAGALLLARVDHAPVGAVGLRPLGDGLCEMKRLYVRAPWRRLKLGRKLAERVIDEARRAGYRAMRLDTLARLEAANKLYESLGFRRIPAYYDNPLAGVRFFELDLMAPERLETA